MDSLDRAKAYGDYLPIEGGGVGEEGRGHGMRSTLGADSYTLSLKCLFSHTPPLPGFCRSVGAPSARLRLTVLFFSFSSLAPSLAVIRHPQCIAASSPFPSLLHFLLAAPIHPMVIMEKSVIVLRGADNNFSLIKDIYGM